MLKIVTVCALALVASSGVHGDASRPIINTTGGQIQGVTESCSTLGFCTYFAFNGIPYAEPPVGELRFRNTQPHRGWTGVKDGSEHRPSCPSSSMRGDGYSGDEDCLFLNVYTQQLVGRRPVMVWIHGGSFSGGSGDSWIYGPDHLVQEPIVLVTINYRLGLLGFFSTGDHHAQGNWGMKDCVEALRWVRNNIANFGGDPDNVTIFGESAGAAAVHYLVLSPMATGLFHKAIAQSGTTLVPWGFQYNPREMIQRIHDKLGYPTNDNAELVRLMRYTPKGNFVNLQEGWTDIAIPRGFKPFEFVPTAEPLNSPEPTFLTQRPIDILKAGTFNKVPFIIGYNNHESLFMIHEHRIDSTVWNEFERNPHFFVPHFWNIQRNSAAETAVHTRFRQLYFQNRPLNPDIMMEWVLYHTDQQFIFPCDKAIRLTAEHNPHNTYYYQFSFDGALNLPKRAVLLSDWPGAMHADELPYLFSMTNFNAPVLPSNPAAVTRNRMVRMWANFAITGSPTPNSDTLLQNINWAPYNAQTRSYLEVDTNLVVRQNPNSARLDVWYDLEQNYANDPFHFPWS
ncbi:carboxylesterase 5A-like [Uranotaenia lowii]|uniref:carboxylesterase 5A-like n=1 Tax=Uranotaenia lowii TaxID=190385 RepID=UPI00247AD4D2|nr:carboxylesterase 5A-like [Uranotaenia lowii]XP_055587411.1 carboxylesterase 5A-like [Uranotaenia lowii]